ncbi:MAG: bifunctional DNA-formamidopyrimidine glycosylase/DNA-(apurinic or apyrimidinic site) lyase [Proteobacteria bacterium]|nr:bifunctional DNA-formamidopyrimidine glycosylase/DNA-(apurinic or apyrimidinic site) lyase [Pseudomonadota bacterium]
MPELPEVETTRRGLKPHVVGQRLSGWVVRNPNLRWPVAIPVVLRDQGVRALERRGKYLLFRFDAGTLIVHLGMSGSLQVVRPDQAVLKHDHVDLVLSNQHIVRFNDPRRFGCVLFHPAQPEPHWLLQSLGIEPFDAGFDGAYLKKAARGRRVAVKNMIMDGRIVVGVGNIYAAESLFLAGIRPTVAAHRVTGFAFDALAGSIKQVLSRAIESGGTTLKDFVGAEGRPGYFAQHLNVYGRGGEPCWTCGTVLKSIILGQRATVFCPKCQRSQGFARR